jgi:PIN domain nuclease of toxin-antitoxin system
MINFLLDTNVLLWYFWGSDRIDSIKDLLASEEADVFISVVSLWEIMIKVRAGKLNVNLDELRSFAKTYAFTELPVTGDYINTYLELPSLHRDPFDHMLLAQAITCPMRLITGDSQLAAYSSLVMAV